VRIREARPEENDEIGELTARVYLDGGYAPAGSPYLPTLRDARRRAEQAYLLVESEDGTLVGSVTFTAGGTEYTEIADDGEAD